MEQKKGKAGEQLKDTELSDCSSLLQSQSGPSQPGHWSGSFRPTDVSDHRPAPRKLSTIEAANYALDPWIRTYSAAEQLKDKDLSDLLKDLSASEFSDPELHSLFKSQSGPSQPGHLQGSSRFTDVSDHLPAPRKLSTIDEEKGPLDGRSVTYSAAEQLKDNKLSDYISLLQSQSGTSRPRPWVGSSGPTDVSDHQPAQRKLSTIDAEGPLDGQSLNYRAEYLSKHLSLLKEWPRALREALEPRKARKPSFPKCLQLRPTLKKKHSAIISTTDSSDYPLDQPPPVKLTEAGMTKKHSSAAGGTPGVNQDDTRDMELHAAAGPSSFQLSTSSSVEDVYLDPSNFDDEQHVNKFSALRPSSLQLSTSSSEDGICLDAYNFDDEWFVSLPSALRACAGRFSTVCPEGSRTQDVYELLSEPGGDGGALPDMDVPVTAANCSVTNTLPAHSHLQIFSSDSRWSRRDSSCLPRSHSMPSLSQITSPNPCRGAGSLPNMLLNTSFEEFTPDITDDEHDETYRFQCSGPGLYRCSVTSLVFHMEGEGVLVYRTVPWSRRLLVQHHKRPAGPLFDIKCVPQSVCRLHLPHCEIRSTGGGDFLSVAHVTDEDVEFISPHEITETHVIINITGFSAFGNVKDEDSPADPVRALVLLFYKPPADPVLMSLLNVLLLPRNVVLRDVLRFRKKLVGDERYIETSPHCKLQLKQEYSLSTRPEDDSVLVQPKEAEFDCDNYDNYFPSFQVRLKTILTDINLFLRDTNSSHSIWEREVCLSSTGGRRNALNLPLPERLMDIRSSFVDSISGPVLKSLLDKLLEKKVIGDSEWGSADVMQNNSDKARFVIDTVRRKGEAASSEMIEFLCEADPFLCEHLGLT